MPDAWAAHSATNVHPGSNNDHAAMRSWLALFDGRVDITYTASDADAGGGDGVTTRIYRNDALLPGSELIIPNGGAGGTVQLHDVQVAYGDFIHFAVLPNGNDWWDSTSFSAHIRLVPEPTTMAILAGGVLALAARRRKRKR